MKASEEAEQALLAFQKADQDMANSRLQIEKVNCCIKAMMYYWVDNNYNNDNDNNTGYGFRLNVSNGVSKIGILS